MVKTINLTGIDTINKMLIAEEKQRSEFQRNLLTAIDFYGNGLNEPLLRNALISFIISLESLLLRKGEPKTQTLAERIALLLQSDSGKRVNIFERVKKLYQLRSDLVHEGIDIITCDHLYNAATLTHAVIMRLIPFAFSIEHKTDLKDKLVNLKFSCPEFTIDERTVSTSNLEKAFLPVPHGDIPWAKSALPTISP